MKLIELQNRIHEQFKRDRPLQSATLAATDITDYLVEKTVLALGFHFGHDGTICDPRPAQPSHLEQRNVRWGGGRRKR